MLIGPVLIDTPNSLSSLAPVLSGYLLETCLEWFLVSSPISM